MRINRGITLIFQSPKDEPRCNCSADQAARVPHKDRHPGKITPQLHRPLGWQRRVPPQVGQSLAVDELAVLASVEQSPTLPESACQ